MRAVGWLVVALLFVEVEHADACTCGPETPIQTPQNGATGVVVDAVIVARGLHHNIELRTGTVSVATDSEEIALGYVAIKPRLPLSPNTQYEVLFDSGTSTFTTGDQLDAAPPAPPTLRAITPETMAYPINNCVSTCISGSGTQDGHISRIGVDHALPSDAVFAVIELRDQATNTVERRAASSFLGFYYCDQTRAPILDPEGTYCARIVAYNAAGKTSHSDEICRDATRCKPIADPDSTQDCAPSPTCVPDPGGSGGCSATRNPAGLAGVLIALSLGWSRRSGRRRRARATPPAP